MFNLNISHSGVYECHVKYPKKDPLSINVYLNVTAKYTKPEVKKNCNDLMCMVTCSSYGGYPRNSITWSVPGSQKVWTEMDSNVTDDPNTMRKNISSTVHFNCSNGELQHIRCSVGEVTSDMFSVCSPSPPPGNHVIPIAISALVAVSITSIVLLLLWRCKKKRTDQIKHVSEKENLYRHIRIQGKESRSNNYEQCEQTVQ
ncbi:hypothetical protein GBF38_012429 [Nibea albiflora]|uniref:Uncharacterized protein n=1 Tax=Nibea albiflora TaxID=240163 RepID=A0ACB7EKB1_NIBAL|nr:hypothetical protein GBF38_012429 [Nibea albiflora]